MGVKPQWLGSEATRGLTSEATNRFTHVSHECVSEPLTPLCGRMEPLALTVSRLYRNIDNPPHDCLSGTVFGLVGSLVRCGAWVARCRFGERMSELPVFGDGRLP